MSSTGHSRNHQGEYDAPAPTQRRDKDELDALHQILRNHLEDLSRTQYDIIVETFYEKRKRAEVAAHRGIRVNTCDTHRKAAFRTRRDSMTTVADFSTVIDLPD